MINLILSMLSIMEKIAQFLDGNLKSVKSKLLYKDNLIPVNKFVVEISADPCHALRQAGSKITLLIDSFDKYPLLALKAKSYINWKEVYVLILAKKHLTRWA